MINASKEFKEKLKNGANVVNYADVTLSDGTVLHLEPKDFMIGGCSIEDKTTDGKFGVGFVIGKTLTIRLANHDERFSQYDFYGSIIHLYVALLLDDGTIEKIRKGIYYAMVPQTPGDIIEISAVDGMYRLDKDYSASTTSYPAALQNIITGAFLDCNIPIGFTQFDNMAYTVQTRPEKATYRQVVSWACQIAGYNAHIDNNGYMQLIWYNTALLEQYNYDGGNFKVYPHDTVIDGGNFTDYSTDTIMSGGDFANMPEHIFRVKSLDVHTDDVQITGVRVVGDNDVSELFGEEGYVIEVSGNPFSAGRESQLASYLGGRMVGMTFRPFSAQVLSNPLYEPFEIVRITDRKGNVYDSIINSVSYTIGAYTQVACEAEDPLRNGSTYFSESAAAVVEARRNTEKQLSNYDKAVQNMTQLAGNALGYHTTYEKQDDGSTITYLHDKPTLAGSRIIYKQTIDGFFISQDGGQTYTAGFDAQGNAVVNILYAIGIVADWIRGGTLTLGGYNNIDGSCVIYDANGNEIGRLDKSGITTNSANITGGSFNVTTQSNNDNRIVLKYADYLLSISPSGISVKKGDAASGTGYIALINANEIGCENIHSYGTLRNGNFFKTTLSSVDIDNGNINFKHDVYGSVISIADTMKIMGNSNFGGTTRHSFEIGNEISFLKQGSTIICKLKNVEITGYCILNGQSVKSKLCRTENYSERLLYCYETPKPYFGDIGEATLDEDGVCYIFLDDIFAETVNTECQYQVFLQKYGSGDVWVEERTANYFVVKGTPNLRFGWEIKAVQLGFEMDRLEKFSREEPESEINYETEAQNYIDSFYKEVFNYEESD